MIDQDDWKVTKRWKPPHGFGLAVERDEQLGYAKSQGIWQETLAAGLAQLVGAPVPQVDVTTICGQGYAVSHVSDPTNCRLAEPHDISRVYSEPEKTALREASGLIAFAAWIDAFDHGSEANYVVEKGTEGQIRVVAIDFEDAFGWSAGIETIMIYAPHELVKNMDRELLSEMVDRIERVTFDEILTYCTAAGIPEKAPDLDKRRQLLRVALQKQGLPM
jgi:hypothetical protein